MDIPPQLETEPPEPAEPMPLGARLLNVFAVPSEVFENVRMAPRASTSWIVPLLIACVVGVVASLILFSRPAIVQEVRNQQQAARTKQVEKFDKLVEQGKMKQEDADRAIQGMDKVMEFTGKAGFLKIAGSAGAVVASIFRIFWWAFALWLIALLILKSRIRYSKALEVVGLSSMIEVLGMVVTLLLQVNLSRTMATPSLGLAVSEFDPSNRMHVVLGAINLVQVWMIIVMALGLSRLAGVPFARASLMVIGFWLLQTAILVLIGGGLALM